jgi:2'-5' RNA ligase
MSAIRLFVALIPPATVRTELAMLAVRMTGVRWVPEQNFHLTMRFIGETSPEKLERYSEKLTRVRVEPFILPVENVGVFPARGPAKTLWAGVGNAHTRLFQLRKQIDEALLAVDGGLDVRHFHPHFTLGRLGEDHEPKELEKFLARHKSCEAPPFRVSEFHLMASELRQGSADQSGAPVYRSVQAFPLQAKPAP